MEGTVRKLASEYEERVLRALAKVFKVHPWHGITIGKDEPDIVHAYIEMVPTDTVKYEIDKLTGFLRVDRPQRYSSMCPTLYGFIPQTLCGPLVGEFSAGALGRERMRGDGDALDICVLTEKTIQHGDVVVEAIPIGGLRMVDGNEADDKIIAVLHQDIVYGNWLNVEDCPADTLERLRHYFLTYKDVPGTTKRTRITHLYGADEAKEIIRRSHEDYKSQYADEALLISKIRETE